MIESLLKTTVLGKMFEEIQTTFTTIIQNPVKHLLLPIGEILFIILLAYIGMRVINRVIDQMFTLSKLESNTAKTLRKLMQSAAFYTISFIAILTILSKLGINLGPVLAGASIVGLAIGFGAQSLVKDIITGFFLIFERQLEVGDVVEINGQIRGTVEEVGLRVTKIREYNQRLHYLANGTITQVTNYNRDKMRAIVPITVPYESDLDLVNQALEQVCENVKKEYKEHIIQDPEVVGITNIDPTGVQFTITTVCDPKEVWTIERAMRKEAVLALHRHGIEIARIAFYHPEYVKQKQSVKA